MYKKLKVELCDIHNFNVSVSLMSKFDVTCMHSQNCTNFGMNPYMNMTFSVVISVFKCDAHYWQY